MIMLKLKPIVDKALPYLDARLKEEYDNLVKNKVNLSNNNLIVYCYPVSVHAQFLS